MRTSRMLPWICGTVALAVLAGCGTSLPGMGGRKAPSLVRAQADDAWKALPDAPTARFNAAGVANGLTLFVLGGYDDNLGRLATTETFKAFDTWSSAPALPTPRSSLMAALVPASRVLAIGGMAGSAPMATTEMYTVDKGTWERVADMPTARWGAGVAQMGVFAYVAGGASYYPTKAFEVFDVRDKKWTKLPDMPTAREGCVAARLGQRIAVVGGHSTSGMTGALELYNVDKGEWVKGAPMPTPRAYAAYAIYGHHLFVLGGRLEAGATDAVESYDLATNTWTKRASLPVALHGAVASKLGERLVVTGGMVNGHASNKSWMTTFPFGTLATK